MYFIQGRRTNPFHPLWKTEVEQPMIVQLEWGLNHCSVIGEREEVTYRTLRLWRPWSACPEIYFSWFPEIRLEEKHGQSKKNKKWNSITHIKKYKSYKRGFAFYFIQCFWIELWHDFILQLLLWGYCRGSMQITIFFSLQCGCYWPKAYNETLTNPGSSDEWVNSELNETDTGLVSAVGELHVHM